MGAILILQRLASASRFTFSGLPESVLLDFFDAEPLHDPLSQAEILDEVGAIHIAYIINKFPWPLLSSSTKCRGSNTR